MGKENNGDPILFSISEKPKILCYNSHHPKARIHIRFCKSRRQLSFWISSLRNIYFNFVLALQCQTTNEEEIFEVQDNQSLFPLGWIHVRMRT